MTIDTAAEFDIHIQVVTAQLQFAFNNTHQTKTTHIGDDGDVTQGLQLLLQVRSGFLDLLKQLFTLHDLQILDTCSRCDRMSGIGKSIGEHRRVAAMFLDFLDQAIRHQEGTHGDVTRSQTLCRGNDIRHDAENSLGGKTMAQTTESGYHFIRQIEHVILAAHFQACDKTEGK